MQRYFWNEHGIWICHQDDEQSSPKAEVPLMFDHSWEKGSFAKDVLNLEFASTDI